MQYGWEDYFTFTKKERRAVVTLLAIMIIISFLPVLFPAEKIELIELASTDSIPQTNDFAKEETESASNTNEPLQPFTFDPNTAEEELLNRMNMRPKLIRTIINYRNKGGKFFKPDDLRKLFTITKEEADILVPFVRIHSIQNEKYFSYERSFTDKTKPIDHVIDINAASLDEIKSLPGVSFSLANKIFKYREVIGGFKNAEQLKKTYGMSDSIYNGFKAWIVPFPEKSSLININTATYKELVFKNIIPDHVAKAIIIYRDQHKGFKSVSELMSIPFISKELYEKMAPSLTID